MDPYLIKDKIRQDQQDHMDFLFAVGDWNLPLSSGER